MTPNQVRRGVISTLAKHILEINRPHPVRVAINGIDAAGKSRFADELADFIQQTGRQVIRASIDGFHNPKAVRYRLGIDSASGYYYDSFDNHKLIDCLLRPLGPKGNREYCIRVFDYLTDSPVQASLLTAAPDAILIVDGVFLFRPVLKPYWDYRIYLQVSFEVALERALKRYTSGVDAGDALVARYHDRYFAGQQIYLRRCQPESVADAMIDNNNLLNPVILSIR